jgi:hypothetical protein
MKKARSLGLPAAALAFILALTGCPDPAAGEQDVWTEVTDANALAGNWKGSGAIAMPAQSAPLGREEGALVLPFLAASLDIAMTLAVDGTNAGVSIAIDLSAYLDAMAKILNSNPDLKGPAAWGVILTTAMNEELSEFEKLAALFALGLTDADVAALMAAFVGGGDQAAAAAVVEKITITKDHLWGLLAAAMGPDAEKYYVTVEMPSIPREDLLNENSAIYSNQNGTKIKLAIPKDVFDGLGVNMPLANDVGLILHKQQ